MVIKAHELRVDNYYLSSGMEMQIMPPDIVEFYQCELDDVVSNCEVIPLTEEWLVKVWVC